MRKKFRRFSAAELLFCRGVLRLEKTGDGHFLWKGAQEERSTRVGVRMRCV